MAKWFIALLWITFLLTIVLTLLPQALGGTTRQVLYILLASSGAYLVLYAFAVDTGSLISRDAVTRVLDFVRAPVVRWRQRAATSRRRQYKDVPISADASAGFLRALAWPLLVIVAAVFLFFDRLPHDLQRALAAFLGFLCLGATVKLWQNRPPASPSKSQEDEGGVSVEEWVLGITWILFLGAGVGTALDGGLTELTRAGAVLLLGTLTLCSTCCAVRLLVRNHVFTVEGNWGGLGGGISGWRFSLPVVFLVMALFFGGTTALVARRDGPRKDPPQAGQSIAAPAQKNVSIAPDGGK